MKNVSADAIQRICDDDSSLARDASRATGRGRSPSAGSRRRMYFGQFAYACSTWIAKPSPASGTAVPLTRTRRRAAKSIAIRPTRASPRRAAYSGSVAGGAARTSSVRSSGTWRKPSSPTTGDAHTRPPSSVAPPTANARAALHGELPLVKGLRRVLHDAHDRPILNRERRTARAGRDVRFFGAAIVERRARRSTSHRGDDRSAAGAPSQRRHPDEALRVRPDALDPRALDPAGAGHGLRVGAREPDQGREPQTRVPRGQPGGEAARAGRRRPRAHRVGRDRALPRGEGPRQAVPADGPRGASGRL